MTISTTTRIVTHDGNGVAVNFTYPFKIADQVDLLVYLKSGSVFVLKTLGTDYSVSGAGNPSGGTVTFVTPPASAAGNVRFLRRTALTQLVDYITNDDFPAEIHEAALDKLTMAVQDYLGDSLILDATGDFWDAESKVIKNVADPVDAQDAATKAYGETNWGGAAADAAASSAAAAANSATASANSATASANSATAAANSATQAADSATAAQAAVGAVLVDVNDTTAGKLASKLVAGSGVALSVQTPGGNESLKADALLHGQCVLKYISATQIRLDPMNGNLLTINGSVATIPSAGVTLGNGGLSAGQLYYIYAYMNSGTMTLEASTSTHVTDSTTGIERKTGDASRVLVGMVRTNASSQFADAENQRFVRSWFNRTGVYGRKLMGSNSSTTSVSFVELNGGADRIEFLTWADEAYISTFTVRGFNAATGAPVWGSLGLDGSQLEPATRGITYSAGGDVGFAVSVAGKTTEGYHYQSIMGCSDGTNNATWYATNCGHVLYLKG